MRTTHSCHAPCLVDGFSQGPNIDWSMLENRNRHVRVALLFVKHVELVEKVELCPGRRFERV